MNTFTYVRFEVIHEVQKAMRSLLRDLGHKVWVDIRPWQPKTRSATLASMLHRRRFERDPFDLRQGISAPHGLQ